MSNNNNKQIKDRFFVRSTLRSASNELNFKSVDQKIQSVNKSIMPHSSLYLGPQSLTSQVAHPWCTSLSFTYHDLKVKKTWNFFFRLNWHQKFVRKFAPSFPPLPPQENSVPTSDTYDDCIILSSGKTLLDYFLYLANFNIKLNMGVASSNQAK